MKIFKIRYYGDGYGDGDSDHAPWDTDTMYLSGENSIFLVYRFFNKVEFYSKTPTEYSRVYNFYGIKPK
jgi:hypothetical protein